MFIELDCDVMTSRKDAHDYLQQQLQLPVYYGRNLDALYDVLTSVGTPMTIVVKNEAMAEDHLGGYGSALIATIREAGEENPAVTVII